MFDFIPIIYYTSVYYYIIFITTIIVVLQTHKSQLTDSSYFKIMNYSGIFLFVFVLLYMGLRPISGAAFLDMRTYAKMFTRYQNYDVKVIFEDPGFHYYLLFSSKIMSLKTFFFIDAFLYIFPLYLVCRKWFPNYWFYAFLFLLGSFSFWVYGVNGIRNGIAGSLFLLGISREKRVYQILWIIISINFHLTMLLPTIGLIIASIYNNPKKMILFWITCIVLSIVMSGFWEGFFAKLGIFDDNRMSYLTSSIKPGMFSRSGYRWDFLLYSASAVFAGWYYIVVKDYKDKTYYYLFNTFVFANSFWILVNRANFSNRFAYLSWFMMTFVIIYPLLKEPIIKHQHERIGYILFGYALFTTIMNVFVHPL
jgi:hypothetical protein